MVNNSLQKAILPVLICILIGLSVPVSAGAATIYVGPNETYKTIQAGFAAMSGGDTLIIRNGVYTGTSNSFSSGIKSGTASAYTVIKAENDGGVEVNAPFYYDSASTSYVQIEGLKFTYTSSIKGMSGNHIKYLRCAFVGGPSSGNVITFAFGGSYNLMEDCWVYGAGGRYKVLLYRANHNIMRRCVVRQDAGWTYDGSNPEAGICVYESSNISLQNCIVIDSTLTYSGGYVGAYYLTGHAGNPASNNVEYLGCMSINNTKGCAWHVDTDDGGVGLVFRDLVAYNNMASMVTSNTSMDMTIQRATIGNSTMYSFANWGSKTMTVVDSDVWNTGQYKGTIGSTYTNTYNPAILSGTGVTHINPLTNGQKYLTRIEDATTLKTGGQSDGQRGANVMYRVGQDGKLWGEAGYNTVTATALWPWPNEARIKSEMASFSARGFCTGTSRDGSAQTLTKYIWEQLGNTIPANIYAGSQDMTPPSKPAGISVIIQ